MSSPLGRQYFLCNTYKQVVQLYYSITSVLFFGSLYKFSCAKHSLRVMIRSLETFLLEYTGKVKVDHTSTKIHQRAHIGEKGAPKY